MHNVVTTVYNYVFILQVCNSRTSSLKYFTGSEVHQEFEKLALNERHLRDVAMLSSNYQTANLEAFHSLLLQFTPKSLVYSYKGMLAR